MKHIQDMTNDERVTCPECDSEEGETCRQVLNPDPDNFEVGEPLAEPHEARISAGETAAENYWQSRQEDLQETGGYPLYPDRF